MDRSMPVTIKLFSHIKVIAILLILLLPTTVWEYASAENLDREYHSTNSYCTSYSHPHSSRDYLMLWIRAMSDRDVEYSRGKEGASKANSKLDEYEQNLESWKTADKCFGQGKMGEEIAKNYHRAKERIDKKRKEIEDRLVVEEARKKLHRTNEVSIIQDTEGMKLEIVLIEIRPGTSSFIYTEISIKATNTTNTKIHKPKNQQIYGYEDGSDVGGRMSIGSSLVDSFGNKYKLNRIEPGYLGDESMGIKPGQSVLFKITFGDTPLKNSKLVHLTLQPNVLGQNKLEKFDIPIQAFNLE